MSGILYPDESYTIVGACFNVYKAMGCGFLENVYQECLEIEFGVQKIPFESHKELKLCYKNKQLNQTKGLTINNLNKFVVRHFEDQALSGYTSYWGFSPDGTATCLRADSLRQA